MHELAWVVDMTEPDDVCELVVDDRLCTVDVVSAERGEEVAVEHDPSGHVALSGRRPDSDAASDAGDVACEVRDLFGSRPSDEDRSTLGERTGGDVTVVGQPHPRELQPGRAPV
ncbi:MAG: hypothetical protein H6529_05405 [Nocardioides sp.]|nr:hypothetical protein [Nocardioides sp.]